jgi:tetratricopeptide (TPR) repeat protein
VLHTIGAFTSEPDPESQLQLAFAARLQKHVTDDAFRARWYVVAGLGRLFRGDLTLARSTLTEGLERFEADPGLLVALGATYEVEEWLQRLVLRPGGAEGVNRAQRLTDQRAERVRCWTEAADRYEQALARDPGHPEAHLRLGRVELLLGRTDEGLEELRWVRDHAVEPDLVYLAHLFTGREQKRSGQLDAALASYRAALDADPGGQAASVATSQALYLSGDREAAADTLEHGLAARRGARARDAWWHYPEGRPGQLAGLLSRLHDEACR